ncbi:MAG: prepilin-type N-terminal cleavage/methylation domain-containing protein [Verrucomicrobia subdivision 3 bacterium]|nr:prepilin-type N-terminal cleavage/methylation domain-containing protein [Limisphaerales bacterium]
MTAATKSKGFTIIEVMIAIAIFAMVITSIYTIWMAIGKGTRASLKAAAQVQRSRIAMRCLRDAFANAQLFTENMKYYAFETGISGDMSAVSMASRLPASFPGVAIYPDLAVRRITFVITNDTELVMSQTPILVDREDPRGEPYRIVLARDVTMFTVEFWDQQKREYVTEWLYTNQLPQKVIITLGTGKSGAGSSTEPTDITVKEVLITSAGVAGLQAGPGVRNVDPGAVPPGGGIPPGGAPPGTLPPRTQTTRSRF